MDTPWDWYVDGLDDLPGIGDDDNDDNPDDDYMDHINGGGHGEGWTDPVGPGSAVPIVLDLNGSGGVDLVARATSTTFFDIDNDGYLERASWIGVDAGTGLVEDGFLVADFNADGHITANELALATATADPDDTDLQALASLFDSNQSGVINAADTDYAKLKVWKDLDRDGETDAGELHSLAHHGITSINVSSAWDTADAMTAAQLAQWGVTATDLTEEDLSDGSTRTVAALEGGNSLFGITNLSMNGGTTMLAGDLALAVDPVGFRQDASGALDFHLDDGNSYLVLDNTAGDSTLSLAGSGYVGVMATAGTNGFTGTDQAEFFVGGTGVDTINAGGGDDTIIGGDGADTLTGDDGDDLILFDHLDSVQGGTGFDVGLFTSTQNLTLDMALTGLEGAFGGTGNDSITASDDGGFLVGGQGNDVLNGGAADDYLIGDDGVDQMFGGDGNDSVFIDAEDLSQLNGVYSLGTYIDGGAGHDTLIYQGTTGQEIAFGSAHFETVVAGDGNDILRGTAGAAKTVIAGGGDDQVYTGSTDDYIEGGAGADQIDAGGGNDTAAYTESDAGIYIDLHHHTVQGGHATGDTLIGIENVVGSTHDDTLLGRFNASDHNMFFAGDGNDAVWGRDGDDIIVGGRGADTMGGNAGADTYIFDRVDIENDRVLNDDTNNDIDVVQFGAGIHAQDIRGQQVGNNLVAWDVKTGQTITFEKWYDPQFALNDRVEYFIFDDGSQWTWQEVEARAAALPTWMHPALFDGAWYLEKNPDVTTDPLDHFLTFGNDEVSRNPHALFDTGFYDSMNPDVVDGNWFQHYLTHGHAELSRDPHPLFDSSFYAAQVAANTATFPNGLDGANPLIHYLTVGWKAGLTTHALFSQPEYADVLPKTTDMPPLVRFILDHDKIVVRGADANVDIMGPGNNALFGRSGDDILDGAVGDDDIWGGTGADTVYGTAGNDRLYGDAGADTLWGGHDDDRLEGGDGDDVLHGQAGNDVVLGGAGNDLLYGSSGEDIILGGTGDDQLFTSGGVDGLYGGSGVDRVNYSGSTAGVDVDLTRSTQIGGWAEGDTVVGVEDILGSLTQGDTLAGDGLDNTLWGLGGNDTLDGRGGADTLWGGDGNDTLRGGTGDDQIDGGAGDDVVYGGTGDDHLFTSGGVDIFYGGSGVDTIDYGGSDAGISVDLTQTTQTGGWAQGDSLTSIENINGSSHGDVLHADDVANALYGFAGNDTFLGRGGNDDLHGKAGNDTLNSGTGDDRMWGNTGDDTFIIGATHGHDRIMDFENGQDTVQLIGSYTTWAQVSAALSQDGADVVLDMMIAGNSVRFEDTLLSELDHSDFLMA